MKAPPAIPVVLFSVDDCRQVWIRVGPIIIARHPGMIDGCSWRKSGRCPSIEQFRSCHDNSSELPAIVPTRLNLSSLRDQTRILRSYGSTLTTVSPLDSRP